MSETSVVRWVFRLFGIVGLIFLAVGLFTANASIVSLRKGVTAEGRVTDIAARSTGNLGAGADYTYSPIVEFKDQAGTQHSFRSKISSNPPRYAPGDRVQVVYPPDNPARARVSDGFSLFFLPAIFGGIGFLFTLMWIVYGVIVGTKRRKRRNLERHGRAVMGQVVEVELVRNVHVNRKNPFRLHVEATDPIAGKTQSYKSGYIWNDPSRHLPEAGVRVLVDPKKPDLYLVDLSFLPKS